MFPFTEAPMALDFHEYSHKFTTYWIAACIGIHTFVMQCEGKEQEDTDSDFQDPFIAEGLSSSSDLEVTPQLPRRNINQHRLQSQVRKT
jgi:hypothetical protein